MLRISDVEPTTALDGLFTNGKVASGVSPTRLVAEWFNAVQTELVNVVEGAGLTIDPDNSAQVFAAIKIITLSLIPDAPVTSVNSKTGVVTLDAEDVGAYPATGGDLSGSLNTTGQISEAGQRVYSPNNPPPANIEGAITGIRLAGHVNVQKRDESEYGVGYVMTGWADTGSSNYHQILRVLQYQINYGDWITAPYAS
ncbi:hypothetical protein [uncultured Klebsiella sp.]|uniref:hypothetical protein n=1 Tax=uncultured Klebsiella sp. TaxID=284011 RepID=UPI002803D6E5|nr:hypothetical protein [uncultured Klebsiella sp.]